MLPTQRARDSNFDSNNSNFVRFNIRDQSNLSFNIISKGRHSREVANITSIGLVEATSWTEYTLNIDNYVGNLEEIIGGHVQLK